MKMMMTSGQELYDPNAAKSAAAAQKAACREATPSFHVSESYRPCFSIQHARPVPDAERWARGKARLRLHHYKIHRDILTTLRAMGWWTGQTSKDAKRYRLLRDSQCAGAWGRLRARIDANCGISSVEFYSDHNTEHGRGPRYSSAGLKAMDHLTRIRFRFTVRGLSQLLTEHGYLDRTDPTFPSVLTQIDFKSRAGWHFKGQATLWEKRNTEKYNDTDGSGRRLANGMVRYYYGPYGDGGGIRRGIVFADINSNWWVVAGNETRCISSYKLFPWREGMPRRAPGRQARRALTTGIDRAVKSMDFERAIPMRDALRAIERAA